MNNLMISIISLQQRNERIPEVIFTRLAYVENSEGNWHCFSSTSQKFVT
jgi:hypothetical protein